MCKRKSRLLRKVKDGENIDTLKMSSSKSTESDSEDEFAEKTSLLSSPDGQKNLLQIETKSVLEGDSYGGTKKTHHDFMVVRTSHGERRMSIDKLDEVVAYVDHEISVEEKHEIDLDKWEDALDPPQLRDSLPMSLRLYLENNIFGWTNIFSATIGHLAFALIAYAIASFSFDFFFTIYLSSKANTEIVQREEEWERIYILKAFVTIFAGFIALRLVRRQRRVWLRSSYGTPEYTSDIVVVRRKSELEIVDKSTMLGRLRSKVAAHRHRRHSRHVRKATKRMQRKISKIESVANDQVYITPIANIPYAHGGYFGAAPFLLADPVWVDILRQLMPDVYCEVAKRIFAPTPRLIHWAENNPVVAAYGLTYEKKTSGRVETLEWDVFLDPGLVECVEHGLAELDSLVPDASEEQEAILEGRVKLLSMHLLEKMLIAHGSGPQLLIEQLGFAKHYNFSRVKRTRRTLGGGIYAEQWLSIFADALKLGTDAFMLGAGLSPTKISEHDKPKFPDLSESQNISYPDIEMSSSSSSGCDSLSEFFDFDKSTNLVNKAFCSHSLLQSVRVITERLNQPPSVILDLKSRFVPKRVWGLVVDALRDCGVRVEGVATFYIDDIRGINEYTCTYVPEIVFFHSAGDLQYACHDGTIKKNDTVYFNAGSLLWKKEQKRKIAASSGKTFSHLDMDTAELRYTLHPCAFFNKCREDENIDSRPKFPHYHHHFRSIGHSCPTIEDYKEAYGLKIGVYAQEFAIDEIAADLLCRFVNEYSNVFDLGFSWGGVNGVTVKGIQPGRFTNTDGLWNQRYVSKQWNYNLGPNTYTT